MFYLLPTLFLLELLFPVLSLWGTLIVLSISLETTSRRLGEPAFPVLMLLRHRVRFIQTIELATPLLPSFIFSSLPTFGDFLPLELFFHVTFRFSEYNPVAYCYYSCTRKVKQRLFVFLTFIDFRKG